MSEIAEPITRDRTGRRYHRVQVCDACGSANREVEMISLGRNGLSVLTAKLCRRCGSSVELAVEGAIQAIETERMRQELKARRGR